MKNILAISGSLRAKSTNMTILEIIAAKFGDKISLTIYDGLADLPHFNPDLDTEQLNESVADLRRRIRQSNGVLICSPEYVFSVPAALKNALEWTVSSADFHNKPTALITASSSLSPGFWANCSLFNSRRRSNWRLASSRERGGWRLRMEASFAGTPARPMAVPW